MHLRRIVVLLILLAVVGSTLSATSGPSVARAQTASPWLQVWLVFDQVTGLSTVEYRDGAGNVLAAYTLQVDSFRWANQGGGIVFGSALDTFPYFDPRTGSVLFASATGYTASTDTLYYNLFNAIPSPDSQRYAYSVAAQPSDYQQPTTNWVYVGTTGGSAASVVLQESSEAFMALKPRGWSADGGKLLIENMPVGIGGYILFWQSQGVRALNLNTGVIDVFGSLDGYSDDLRYTAAVTRTDSGVTGLQITDWLAGGQIMTFALPALPELPYTGGSVSFAPSGTKAAYQVARNNPEAEKFWTIVIDLTTGAQRIVLEDEASGYDTRYGSGTRWLDDTFLVVGGDSGQSAVINTDLGAQVGEARGAFLGYAVGLSSTAGFAPSGQVYAQCPGAPISRLQPMQRGRITITGGGPTNVRQTPGLSGEKIGSVAEGVIFTVQSGPTCADGYAWWAVSFDDGTFGYVAEGNTSGYFLEPWQ